MIIKIAVVIFVILGPLFYWGFLSGERRRRRFEDTPTSKAAGVFIGDVELAGTAESSDPAEGPLSGAPVVWYDWSVEEEWRRVEKVKVSEERAKQINQEYEERITTGWTKVDGCTANTPFYLKDDTGTIRINPEKAEVQAEVTFSRTCGPADRLYHLKGPQEAIDDSTGQRRFTERAVPLHSPLFVTGHSRIREDAVAAEIAWDRNSPYFLISTSSEEDLIKGGKAQSIGCRIFFILMAAFVFGAVLRDWRQSLWGAAAGVLTLLPGWLWIVHQSMVKLKNRSKQAVSNVDVELKRRYSLITPLIETVRGMRGFESEAQTSLAALRSQLGVQTVGDADREGVLVPVSKQVLAVMEKYPELKSDSLFLNLQKNLAETEDRIALARQYYNDTVEYVNSRREAFPEGIVAKLSGVRKQEYFHAEEFERPAVGVEL